MNHALFTLLAAAVLSGCATNAPSMDATITGEAAFRERIAIRLGTRFEATLEDVSRADAPSKRLGSFVIDNAGNPPYAFSIAYNPADIKPGHQYTVRATLRNGDFLIFTSDTFIPVISNGKVNGILINMISVP